MPAYRFLLTNLVTGDILGELPLASASYSHVLNGPGAFKGTMALENPGPAGEMFAAGTLVPGQCGIYAERDGVLMWGGVLWTLSADVGRNSLELAGEGFHSYFRHRVYRKDRTYLYRDQALIAQEFLDYALAGAGAIAGLSTASVVATGVFRARTYYAYERKNIGEAIEQLAACVDGFDFRWRPRWDTGGTITTDFLVSYPPRGRATSVVFELGGSVDLATLSMDGTTLAWDCEVLGAGDGDAKIIGGYTDPALTGVYPLLQDIYSENDVRELSTLQAKAQRRVARGRQPTTIPTVVANSATDPGLGSWEIGDQVRVRGSVGWLAVDSVYRITSYEVQVNENGWETIPVTLAPLEAYGA